MKKILIAVVLTAMLFTLCSCDDAQFQQPVSVDNETASFNNASSMFAVVETSNYWWVVYHKETKVMYLISNGMSNCGTAEVMVDAKGNPLLWDDEG